MMLLLLMMNWTVDETYDIVCRLPPPSLLRIDYESYGCFRQS
jgi:hypothetical protein